MGAITFNDQTVNIISAWFVNSALTVQTRRGTDNHTENTDLFTDTAAVGDSVVFGFTRDYNKPNKLTLNIGTAFAGVGVTGVWEYVSGKTSVSLPIWTALSGVTDTSNGFQNTGVQTVSFTVPFDWLNYVKPYSTLRIYDWYIRFRITALTSITEGGKFANIASSAYGTVYAINTTGFTTTPCTFTDIYNASVAGGWGVVAKNLNSFVFSCGLNTTGGSVNNISIMESKQELVQFDRNWWWQGDEYQTINTGELVLGDKTRYGSTFLFYLSDCNFPPILFGRNSKIYNTTIKCIHVAGSVLANGYWGASIGSFIGQAVLGSYFEGFRNMGFGEQSITIAGAVCVAGATGSSGTSSDSHVESPGAIIQGFKTYGGTYGIRQNNSFIGTHIHQCDLSATTYPLHMWDMTRYNNFKFYAVDCNFGIITDTYKYYWVNATATYANGYGLEGASAQIRAIDQLGNALSGATLQIKDKNGTVIYTLTSNADGYFGVESGTVTSFTGKTIIDSSKSWATHQWFYKEVLVTSGSGVGQRRIIKNYNDATSVEAGIAFDIALATNDRFIFVPYIFFKKFVPTSYTTGNYLSTVTDSNPYTFTISKAGYETYAKPVTITGAIVETIKLKSVVKLRSDMDGNKFLALGAEAGSSARMVKL